MISLENKLILNVLAKHLHCLSISEVHAWVNFGRSVYLNKKTFDSVANNFKIELHTCANVGGKTGLAVFLPELKHQQLFIATGQFLRLLTRSWVVLSIIPLSITSFIKLSIQFHSLINWFRSCLCTIKTKTKTPSNDSDRKEVRLRFSGLINLTVNFLQRQ